MPSSAQVSRSRVYERARDLVNRRGANALTMRALASELNVEAPSLYKHVTGKEQILDGICELVYNDIQVDLSEAESWEDRLREYCRAYRQALLMNKHCVPILAIRPVATASAMAVVEVTLQEFSDVGFDPDTGWRLLNVAASFIIGHVLAEVGDQPPTVAMQNHLAEFRRSLSGENYPLAAATIGSRQADRDGEFELALNMLICSIRVMFPTIVNRPTTVTTAN